MRTDNPTTTARAPIPANARQTLPPRAITRPCKSNPPRRVPCSCEPSTDPRTQPPPARLSMSSRAGATPRHKKPHRATNPARRRKTKPTPPTSLFLATRLHGCLASLFFLPHARRRKTKPPLPHRRTRLLASRTTVIRTSKRPAVRLTLYPGARTIRHRRIVLTNPRGNACKI
jgi:hypothetical protein